MYKRSEQGWLKHLDFIFLDVLCAQVALMLAYGLRFGFTQFIYADEDFRKMAIWMALFCVIIAVVFNTMHDVLKRSRFAEIRHTLTQCSLVFAAVVVFLYSVKDAEKYSRLVVWGTLPIYMAITLTTRMLWKRWLLRRRAAGNQRGMLLVTDAASAAASVERFESHPVERVNLCGIVLTDRDGKGEQIAGVPVVANLDDAARYICREWIDEVFIGVSDSASTPYTLMDRCREMGVTVHLQIMPTGSRTQFVERIAGATVVTSSMNFASPVQLFIKRAIDILGGLVLSLLALLAIAIIGPMVKHASPGPVLYKQERIGQNGRKFKMYKIRSMHVDADAHKQELMDQNRVGSGLMFKLDFDPRIIGNEILPDGTHKRGMGEFIRWYSLDELPQGFNVLLGQMSLVGTRPPTVDEWERYEYHHRARLAMKPGITGMWQVQGRSKITDFEEITRLDTDYIANWDIGLDFRILFKTVWVVIQRKGAM